MGRPRIQLHELLLTINPNVYFQPPATVQMEYPAIVYRRDLANTRFSDNAPYLRTTRYQVTVIDRNPDSEILDQIASLPMCLYSRHFETQGLNHDVYELYF